MTKKNLPKKMPAQKIAEATKLAKKLSSEIDKAELVERVGSELSCTSEQALEYISNTKLDTQIHDMLVESISQGAIATKAISKLKDLVEQGNMEAMKMILSFNKMLVPHDVKGINSLHLHSNNTTNNVFAEIAANAEKNLAGKD